MSLLSVVPSWQNAVQSVQKKSNTIKSSNPKLKFSSQPDTFEKTDLKILQHPAQKQVQFGKNNDDLVKELLAEVRSLRSKVAEQDMSGLLEKVVPATASISLGRQYEVSDETYNQIVQKLGTNIFNSLVGRRDTPDDIYNKLTRILGKETTDAIVNSSKSQDEIANKIMEALGKNEADALVNEIEMTDETRGFGSGFWIQCADGKPRMITNYHVVEGSGAVKEVRLRVRGIRGGVPATDTPRYIAELNRVRDVDTLVNGDVIVEVPMKLAVAPNTSSAALTSDYDLAVLEPIDDSFYEKDGNHYKLPYGIEPLEFDDDYKDNKPGQKIIKVGNSAGVQGNVADGIISAFRKRSSGYHSDKEFMAVESTASISSGDSGGALINMEGKVIGVNQSKAVSGMGISIEGVGWAVSSPVVQSVLKDWGFL